MREALAESHAALPLCAPNPPVGCVIVRGDQIVARGFTGRPGHPHAEAAALANLPAEVDPQQLDLYVTLEPCSFTGRTPSCALAIVASGIRRVHVATLDPHPRNSGQGIQMLRHAGIHVQLGVLEEVVLSFIRPHLLSEARQPPVL
jgi:pyrimidine deaminase RibD-like protein